MLNCLRKLYCRRMQLSARSGLLLIIALAVLLTASQSACLKKKNKVAIIPVTGVRIAILPFNIAAANKDLHWAAMAGPIMMAKVAEHAKALEIIPFWQSMPVALESAGASRSTTPESAAYVASWLAVKWSAMGEMSPTKTGGVSMVVDFMPARSSQVPFRYLKSGKIDDVAARLPDAFNQFLRYLTAKPFDPREAKFQTMTAMKSLAEALDREYGWFVEANPGKAQEVVAKLASSDEWLARFLFNPSLYPVLAQTK